MLLKELMEKLGKYFTHQDKLVKKFLPTCLMEELVELYTEEEEEEIEAESAMWTWLKFANMSQIADFMEYNLWMEHSTEVTPMATKGL